LSANLAKMKLSTSLLALGLAIGVVSEPISLNNRDFAAFEGIISAIDGQVDTLISAINGFSGGDGAEVQGASDELVAIIRTGIETANAQPELSQTEALGLVEPVQALIVKVDVAIDGLIAKKEQFVSGGLGGAIKASLAQQHAASIDLATAISSKVPPSLEAIAQELAAGVSAAIQRGVDEYADVPDGGSPSGTATPTGEPSETAQPSETAEPTETSEPTETGKPTKTAEPTGEPTGEPTDAPVYPTGEAPTSGGKLFSPYSLHLYLHI
jgi:hypothetical protein